MSSLNTTVEQTHAHIKAAFKFYCDNEPNASATTMALLESFIKNEADNVFAIKELCDMVDNLTLACQQLKHAFDIERIKNTGKYSNN